MLRVQWKIFYEHSKTIYCSNVEIVLEVLSDQFETILEEMLLLLTDLVHSLSLNIYMCLMVNMIFSLERYFIVQ